MQSTDDLAGWLAFLASANENTTNINRFKLVKQPQYNGKFNNKPCWVLYRRIPKWQHVVPTLYYWNYPD